MEYIISNICEVQNEVELSDSVEFITIETPSPTNTYTFVLPDSLGTDGQILSRNSSGGTQWIDNVPQIVTNLIARSDVTYSNTSFKFYVLVDSMFLTPPAGTYYCMFSSSANITRFDKLDISFFVDGVIQPESLRRCNVTSPGILDNLHDAVMIGIYTVDGTQTIDVRAQLNNQPGVYTFYTRNLIALKIS